MVSLNTTKLIIRNATPTPDAIASLFTDLEAFKAWAEDLLITDLEYWLKEFEEEEMYEHCCVLRDLIIDYKHSVQVIQWMRINLGEREA